MNSSIDSPQKTQPRMAAQLFAYLALAIFVLAAIGIFSDFMVLPHLISPLTWIAGGLSAVLIMVALYHLYTASPLQQKLLAARGQKQWRVAGSCFVAIPLFVFPAVTVGAPVVIHFFTSKPATMDAKVVRKSSGYRDKTCMGRIRVEGYSHILTGSICGMSKELWEQLKPGETLRLRGSQSLVGFSYESFLIVPEAGQQTLDRIDRQER